MDYPEMKDLFEQWITSETHKIHLTINEINRKYSKYRQVIPIYQNIYSQLQNVLKCLLHLWIIIKL